MITIRRVTLALLLTVSFAVLLIAVVLAWNYRQWEYLPQHGPYTSDLDERSRILQDRVEILTRRVGDMELLVLLLLGASGLYSIVFAASSYLGAVSFGRQADRAIANFRDQLGLAMGDLRELKEDTERRLSEEPKRVPDENLEERVAAIGALFAIPSALYNYARFHSIFDFGYSHIPNVLQEPWYRHGLFSLHAIPWNVNKMLFEGFRDAPNREAVCARRRRLRCARSGRS